MGRGKLIVISGASGVGKGTVLGKMMEKRKDLQFSVSATTRPPRPNEVDGVHYYFITKEQFQDMIAKGEFLEYDAHAANYYGTPRRQAEEKCRKGHVLLDIEPKGAAQVRKSDPDAVLIRLPCGWSGPSGRWNSAAGMTMWWSMTMPTAAPMKFCIFFLNWKKNNHKPTIFVE